MKKRILKFIILILLFASCNSKRRSIKWDIQLIKQGVGQYQLINVFSSNRDTQIVFDAKALSYNCYYEEDFIFDIKELPPPFVFKYNQVVVENEAGEKRLYSDLFFETNETKSLVEENCMLDWYNYLKFDASNREHKLIFKLPYLSDLKVRDNDKTVRLHYLFKPNEEQATKGYKELILSSNWIRLIE